VGASPTRQPLQPEATGAAMEVTKWLKPSDSASRIGDGASVQAATRVIAEQASKRTMRRPTRRPFRGRLIRLGERARMGLRRRSKAAKRDAQHRPVQVDAEVASGNWIVGALAAPSIRLGRRIPISPAPGFDDTISERQQGRHEGPPKWHQKVNTAPLLLRKLSAQLPQGATNRS